MAIPTFLLRRVLTTMYVRTIMEISNGAWMTEIKESMMAIFGSMVDMRPVLVQHLMNVSTMIMMGMVHTCGTYLIMVK